MYIILVTLMCSCGNRKECPVCMGRGEVNVYGEVQTCLTCNGEKLCLMKNMRKLLK